MGSREDWVLLRHGSHFILPPTGPHNTPHSMDSKAVSSHLMCGKDIHQLLLLKKNKLTSKGKTETLKFKKEKKKKKAIRLHFNQVIKLNMTSKIYRYTDIRNPLTRCMEKKPISLLLVLTKKYII